VRLESARVTGVGLDENRAPNRQSRCCVSARDGESERKVRRREDRDWADWTQHATEIWSWRTRRRRSVVDRRLKIRTVGDHVGKEPKLAGGTRNLTGQTGGTKMRLRVGKFN